MAEIHTTINRTFRRHEICLEREHAFANWYIRVRAPDGLFVYDGWWQDSGGKTKAEALAEAKRGAQLKPYGVSVLGDQTISAQTPMGGDA